MINKPSVQQNLHVIIYIFLHSGRRPAVQNEFVIAQGHGVGYASPIEAAGQWFY